MADVALIRWHPPGPYAVAFSTRLGGVSAGPFASLNLGIFTDDEPGNVVRNRALLCDAAGADPHRATMARQQHGASVARAEPCGIVAPGTEFPRCDGLWSDEPGQTLLLIAADCLPIALARVEHEKPALAVLHAGRQGVLGGIVAAGVGALGGGRIAAAIGPGIGPCCYEVGEEVAAPYVT